MPKRKNPLITEFVVQVYAWSVNWGGLDSFLWWLLHKKPKEGFLPFAWKINRLGQSEHLGDMGVRPIWRVLLLIAFR